MQLCVTTGHVRAVVECKSNWLENLQDSLWSPVFAKMPVLLAAAQCNGVGRIRRKWRWPPYMPSPRMSFAYVMRERFKAAYSYVRATAK